MYPCNPPFRRGSSSSSSSRGRRSSSRSSSSSSLYASLCRRDSASFRVVLYSCMCKKPGLVEKASVGPKLLVGMAMHAKQGMANVQHYWSSPVVKVTPCGDYRGCCNGDGKGWQMCNIPVLTGGHSA